MHSDRTRVLSGAARQKVQLQDFEACWLQGTVPKLTDYLTTAEPGGRKAFVEALVGIDLSFRWRLPDPASRWPLETYLALVPELAPVSGQLITAEYRARRAAGDTPSPADYAERFPQLAAELPALLAAADAPPVAVAVAEPVSSLLNRLGLLKPAQARELAALTAQLTDDALLDELTTRGWLTPFQVRRIRAGQGDSLIVGPYLLESPLGEGGTSRVYQARHRLMNRVVALKLIRAELFGDDNPAMVERFYREVEAAGRLSHPNVVHTFDAGAVDDAYFLAMEFVPGETLAELVRRTGPLPVERARDHVLQAAAGLGHLHEQGLIHRDIKPSNLLLGAGGTWGQVKLLDVGLAGFNLAHPDPAAQITGRHDLMGTPDYLAPEQAADPHAVDARADLYALGCTWFFLLAGRPPFAEGGPLDRIRQHQEVPRPDVRHWRPDVPESTAELIRRLMAIQPADRPRSVGELFALLSSPVSENILDAVPEAVPVLAPETETIAAAHTQPCLEPLRQPSKPPRRRFGMVLVCGMGVVVLGAVSLMRWLEPVALDSPTVEPPPPPPRVATPFDQLANPDLQTRFPRGTVAILGEPRLSTWGPILALALSSDGRTLATTDVDGLLTLWDAATGRVTATVHDPATRLESVAFAPHGRWLVTGGTNQMLRIWDSTTGKEVGNGMAHGVMPGLLAVAADNQRIAFGHPGASLVGRCYVSPNDDGFVLTPYAPLPMMTRPVTALAFSADDHSLILGMPGAVAVFDPADRAEVRLLPQATQRVEAVAMTDDEVTIVSSTTALRWDRVSGTERLSWVLPTGATSRATLSRHGDRLAWLSGGQAFLSALHEPKPTGTVKLDGQDLIALAPDGGRLTTAASSTGQVRFWDGTARSAPASTGVLATAFTADGAGLFVGRRTGRVDRLAVVGTSLRCVWETPAAVKDLQALALAPDGKTLAVLSEESKDEPFVFLWDVSHDPPTALPPLSLDRPVTRLSFVRDGSTLLTGDVEGGLRLWIERGRESLAKVSGHLGAIQALAISPDGQLVASAGVDGNLRLWDLTSRLSRRASWVPTEGSVTVLRFSGHGDRLISGHESGRMLLWDLASQTRKPLLLRQAHSGPVTAMAVAPDGSRIATGGRDGHINVWDGRSFASQVGWQVPGSVRDLAFAPDGRFLAVVFGHGTALLLMVNP